jgi:DNA-binding PadR family transcriptional regulator
MSLDLRLIDKGYLSARPSDLGKEWRGPPKNLLSITPEGLTALERTVENAVNLVELVAQYSGRKKWKDSLLRLLRGEA